MSFAFYAVVYLLLVAGVSWLAYLSHIPEPYIVAIAVIMLGIGVMNGMESAGHKHSDY
jgi:NhaP-type Na+/H+ or K+/H+ antiporter